MIYHDGEEKDNKNEIVMMLIRDGLTANRLILSQKSSMFEHISKCEL
jgi:hypothetical protein